MNIKKDHQNEIECIQAEHAKSNKILREEITKQAMCINDLKQEISSYEQEKFKEINAFHEQTEHEIKNVSNFIKDLKEEIRSIQENQTQKENQVESMTCFNTKIPSLESNFFEQQNTIRDIMNGITQFYFPVIKSVIKKRCLVNKIENSC